MGFVFIVIAIFVILLAATAGSSETGNRGGTFNRNGETFDTQFNHAQFTNKRQARAQAETGKTAPKISDVHSRIT